MDRSAHVPRPGRGPRTVHLGRARHAKVHRPIRPTRPVARRLLVLGVAAAALLAGLLMVGHGPPARLSGAVRHPRRPGTTTTSAGSRQEAPSGSAASVTTSSVPITSVPTARPPARHSSVVVAAPKTPAARRSAPSVVRPSAPARKPGGKPPATSSSAGSAPPAPHIMVVMMENESESDLIGNPEAPNTNALARDDGVATESYSIGHPSLPNYLELLSGSNQGVTDDGAPSTESIAPNTPTLVNELEAAGVSWKAFMESMPSAGYTGGDTTCCGGQYYQHHDPFVYFPSVTSLGDFAADVVPATGILGDLDSAGAPSFVWVTPNGTDDMHDGPTDADGDVSPAAGDAWLGTFVSEVQSTTWYAQGGKIVIEWDEGMDSDSSGIGQAGEGGGGHIVTIVVSAALAADPLQDATPVNTAGVLRSIETAYGLPFLGDAADPANGDIDSLLDAG